MAHEPIKIGYMKYNNKSGSNWEESKLLSYEGGKKNERKKIVF